MDIQAFILCNRADVNDNSLRVEGTFNKFLAQSFPVNSHPFFVATQVSFYRREAGRHSIALRVDLPGGQKQVQLGPTLPYEPEFGQGEDVCLLLHVVQVNPFRFEGPGLHRAALSVDGRDVAYAPFQVVQHRLSGV